MFLLPTARLTDRETPPLLTAHVLFVTWHVALERQKIRVTVSRKSQVTETVKTQI